MINGRDLPQAWEPELDFTLFRIGELDRGRLASLTPEYGHCVLLSSDHGQLTPLLIPKNPSAKILVALLEDALARLQAVGRSATHVAIKEGYAASTVEEKATLIMEAHRLAVRHHPEFR